MLPSPSPLLSSPKWRGLENLLSWFFDNIAARFGGPGLQESSVYEMTHFSGQSAVLVKGNQVVVFVNLHAKDPINLCYKKVKNRLVHPSAFRQGIDQQFAKNCLHARPRLQLLEDRGRKHKRVLVGGYIRCEAIKETNIPTELTPDERVLTNSESEFKEEEESFVDGSVLTGDGSELRNTVRLVECSMLAATAGLAYFLSNLLRLEAYFGCFFPLPVVISSMRWGAAAGRKTMVATAMLLLILSGPLKAASYLLMHGFVGLTMGAFWKWNLNWGLSIAGCTVVRCLGALGFVLLSSWLLRDNILALITLNAHASVSYMLAALGVNVVPTMPMIYLVFASLLVINCGSFVFLLHVLYAIFLRRLGMRSSISVPGWVERAM